MADFEQSRWADSEFSQHYLDDAAIYLPFRSQFIEAAKSLYAHRLATNRAASILDLGCGDGLFVQELLATFCPVKVTLVDGSAAMLAAARRRLADQANIHYLQASFQELLAGEALPERFDFIYSSLAIHHLPWPDKRRLYAAIHRLLAPGGCFVHYDVVRPPSPASEQWCLSLWRQWIQGHPALAGREELLLIPEQYKGNADNMPDTLAAQLALLTEIGFADVDCYLKHGIFALFGGCKETGQRQATMADTFPDAITKLPQAEIPLAGVSAYLAQGERHQVLFMEFSAEVQVPEHAHCAQWGVVLSGSIELTVDGVARVYGKGEQYFIPAGVPHSATVFAGYADITFFDQKDRYQRRG